MDVTEARSLIEAGGFEIKSEARLGNDTGFQLRLTNGAIVKVFDTGNFNVQGRNKADVQSALGKSIHVPESSTKYGLTRKVFVVYGHDQTSRTQLEAMLRRWGLEPLILDQLPTEGQTVIEKLEAANRAGSLITRLGAILDGDAGDAQKAQAVRDLAQEADAWVGRFKPATAAVEALANYSARSEDESAAKVLRKAAHIRAKALKGIW